MSLNDPQWGKRGNQSGGPPDLDEIWRNVNRRLNDLFGRKREPQDGWEAPGDADEAAREELRFDWAMHSVYDAFTPTYVRQFTPEEVLGWARRAGLVDVRPGAVPSTVIARRAAV